jgi:hypothetical protein
MKSVHLVIPDLFLPKDIAAEVCVELRLPALEKLLVRGHNEILEPVPLENLLCEMFGISYRNDAPIAPVSAAFDGLGAGCWLRADPVHLHLQRNQLLLAGVQVSCEEAAAFCASLNVHFAGQGMEFFAPHPQRWYVRMDTLPRIRTMPLSQVIGGDVRGTLPTGEEAKRWHQVLNEIQMLLHSHPLNEARDARGAVPINSVWLWGGGCDTLLAKPADCGSSREATPCALEGYDTLYRGGCGVNATLSKNYDNVSSDEVLAEMFAAAAGVTFVPWSEQWCYAETSGRQLLVWTALRSALQSADLAAWRTALQDFENGYARMLWQALRSGKIARLQIDILGSDGIRRVMLTRGDTWAFWRRTRRLSEYSMV